jgi:hypothetical protein
MNKHKVERSNFSKVFGDLELARVPHNSLTAGMPKPKANWTVGW